MKGTIAVLRLSSLGDVALLYPVMKYLCVHHPRLTVCLVSAPMHACLFDDCPNVQFIGFDKKRDTLWGLFRLLRKRKLSAIIDLHNVLRTQILKLLFLPFGMPFVTMSKPRKQRRQLLRQGAHRSKPIVQVSHRYAATFHRAGIDTATFAPDPTRSKTQAPLALLERLGCLKEGLWIAVAPFSKHVSKTYPIENLIRFVSSCLARHPEVSIFFVGSAPERHELEQHPQLQDPRILRLPRNLSFEDELACISHTNVVVSMDSANMHLASMYGIPVVSIWGATHPAAGFYGFGQDPDLAVQSPDTSRPCTIFGKNPCGKNGCPHFTGITPHRILEHVSRLLQR